MNEILDFLGLSKFQWDETQLTEQYKADYGQKMDDGIVKVLSEFYKPYNEKLVDFLGEKYDWK